MSSGECSVADTAQPNVVHKESEDKRVFDALAQAQQQYDQYLKITEASSVMLFWSDTLPTPPTPDPLSLTLWPTR